MCVVKVFEIICVDEGGIFFLGGLVFLKVELNVKLNIFEEVISSFYVNWVVVNVMVVVVIKVKFLVD